MFEVSEHLTVKHDICLYVGNGQLDDLHVSHLTSFGILGQVETKHVLASQHEHADEYRPVGFYDEVATTIELTKPFSSGG